MRILLIDSEPLVRDALVQLLVELRPGAAVLQAATAQEGVCALERDQAIGLVVLDPAADGPATTGAALAAVRRTRDDVAVVALGAFESESAAEDVVRQGATAAFSKRLPRPSLARSLGAILDRLDRLERHAD